MPGEVSNFWGVSGCPNLCRLRSAKRSAAQLRKKFDLLTFDNLVHPGRHHFVPGLEAIVDHHHIAAEKLAEA